MSTSNAVVSANNHICDRDRHLCVGVYKGKHLWNSVFTSFIDYLFKYTNTAAIIDTHAEITAQSKMNSISSGLWKWKANQGPVLYLTWWTWVSSTTAGEQFSEQKAANTTASNCCPNANLSSSLYLVQEF